MSELKDPFDDVDPKTESQADYGFDARQNARLQQAAAPMHVLDAHGVEVKESFNPENEREFPTTVWVDGTAVHLHQKVHEHPESDSFGAFGDMDDGEDDVTEWTVVDLSDGEVTLTNVGGWDRRRTLSHEKFSNGPYEPVLLTDGTPRWGY